MRLNRSAAVFVVVAVAVVGISACGEETDGLNPQDTNLALASVGSAMSQIQITAARAASNGQVTAMINCSGAGTATVDGSWDGTDSYAVTIEFDGCTEVGIAIDGAIDTSSAVGEGSASATMSGTLTFSGEVSGTCDVDLHSDAGSGVTLMSGRMCGHDIMAGN